MRAFSPWPVVVVLALGVGVALGTLLGMRLARSSPPRPSVLVPQGFEAERDPEQMSELARTDARTARTPAVSRTAPLAPPVSPLEAAPSAHREPEGHGVIRGRVLDEGGAPLGDVTIVATRARNQWLEDPTRVGAGPPSSDLDDYLRRHGEIWERARADEGRAASAADGGFSIEGLVEGTRYDLHGYRLDWQIVADEGQGSVTPGASVTLRARRVHQVQVRVERADAREVREAALRVATDESWRLFTWTPAQPFLRLSAGLHRVRAYAGENGDNEDGPDAELASEEVEIDIPAHAMKTLTLALQARGGVRGQVLGRARLEGSLYVHALRTTRDAPLDQRALAGSELYARLDGNSYILLDLDPGTYAVGLLNAAGAVYASSYVDVAESVVALDLEVPTADPAGYLIVRAMGPNGAPLDDLEFFWSERRETRGLSTTLKPERVDESGAAWLRPAREFFESWPSFTDYSLTVTHPRYGGKIVRLEEGRKDVSLAFAEPATIVVLVSGSNAALSGELWVQVTHEPGDGSLPSYENAWMHTYRRKRPDGQGIARFTPLAPADLWIDLVLESGSSGSRLLGSTIVSATSGEQSIRFAVPDLSDLTVIARGATGDSWLSMERSGGEDRNHLARYGGSARIDRDGRAVFRSLVPGSYELTGEGFEPIDVTVPRGDLEIDVRAPDAWLVAISDPNGALGRAGLRTGDLVIGVDGHEVPAARGEPSFLFGDGTVEVIVLRGEERLQFRMRRAEGSRDTIGGSLTPAWRP